MTRAIDAAIAQDVMGWKPFLHTRGEYTYVEWGKPGDRGMPWEASKRGSVDPANWKPITAAEIDYHTHIDNYVGLGWQPSERIENAWKVVEKLRELGFAPVLWAVGNNRWICQLPVAASGDDPVADVNADSAPLAICMAALAAVGVEVKE